VFSAAASDPLPDRFAGPGVDDVLSGGWHIITIHRGIVGGKRNI
jgi:hypothetical protein